MAPATLAIPHKLSCLSGFASNSDLTYMDTLSNRPHASATRTHWSGRRRLVVALGVSLALHGGLLAVHPGGWNLTVTDNAVKPASPGTGDAAPIEVRLASYRLQPAQTASPRLPNLKPLNVPAEHSAPSIADMGTGEGRTAHSATATQPKTPLPASGVPLPIYFSADEVTQRAEILEDVIFELPEVSQIMGTGKTILTLFINEAGSVDKMEIEADGISEVLAHAVALPFGKAAFQPAQLDGVAVRSRMRIEIMVRPLLQR